MSTFYFDLKNPLMKPQVCKLTLPIVLTPEVKKYMKDSVVKSKKLLDNHCVNNVGHFNEVIFYLDNNNIKYKMTKYEF